MENKENKAVQLSAAPVPDEYSDWNDARALAFAIREVKRPAVKRLPFSDSPVKRNALVVTQANHSQATL